MFSLRTNVLLSEEIRYKKYKNRLTWVDFRTVKTQRQRTCVVNIGIVCLNYLFLRIFPYGLIRCTGMSRYADKLLYKETSRVNKYGFVR